MLIEYTPKRSQIEYAHNRAREYLANPIGRPIMCQSEDKSDEQMMVGGFLFEAIVREHYQCPLVGEHGGDHDIVIETKKVELVSTIVKRKPHAEYHMLRPFRRKTDATHFIFGCVMIDFTKVWLAGWLPTPAFIDAKNFRRVGEVQHGGFTYKMDCFDVQLFQLKKLRAPKSP